ncbi:hypothetical protein HKBW3S42_02443, partial [Candidatus Hakubella thermalkaliphila]
MVALVQEDIHSVEDVVAFMGRVGDFFVCGSRRGGSGRVGRVRAVGCYIGPPLEWRRGAWAARLPDPSEQILGDPKVKMK